MSKNIKNFKIKYIWLSFLLLLSETQASNNFVEDDIPSIYSFQKGLIISSSSKRYIEDIMENIKEISGYKNLDWDIVEDKKILEKTTYNAVLKQIDNRGSNILSRGSPSFRIMLNEIQKSSKRLEIKYDDSIDIFTPSMSIDENTKDGNDIRTNATISIPVFPYYEGILLANLSHISHINDCGIPVFRDWKALLSGGSFKKLATLQEVLIHELGHGLRMIRGHTTINKYLNFFTLEGVTDPDETTNIYHFRANNSLYQDIRLKIGFGKA